MERILNYYPNYPTHSLYFWEVETLYIDIVAFKISFIVIFTKQMLQNHIVIRVIVNLRVYDFYQKSSTTSLVSQNSSENCKRTTI